MLSSPVTSIEPHTPAVVTKVSLPEMQRRLVEEVSGWSRVLVQREMQGPGDMPRAMHRIEGRYGIPYHVLWTLRYRPPKDIAASIYFALKAAHQAECERQLRLLEHELSITRAALGASHSAVAQVEAVLGAADEKGT